MQSEQVLELDLRQLWSALIRRLWVIVLIFAAAVVGAYFYTKSQTPIYEATTTVLVRDDRAALRLADLDGGGALAPHLQTSLEIFRSRTLALETARRLGYDWDEYTPAFRAFRSRISAQPIASANMIRISVQHPDPAEGARIANALVDAFVDRSRAMNSREARSAREFIEEQLIRFEADLEAAEEALVRYQQTAEVFSPSGETAAVLDSIRTFETRRAEAMVARETARKRLEVLLQGGELSEDKRSAVSAAVVESNPLIASLRSQLVNLEAQLAAAKERYTDRHPTVVSLTAQIEQLRAEMSEQIARLETSDTDNRLFQEIVSVQAEIVGYEATIEALDQLIADREALLGGLPEKELRLTRLIRNANVTEAIYTHLLQRYQEMRISEAMETANVVVLDPAIVPSSPIKPRQTLSLAIAAFLGLFVGVGVAFLLEYLDTTFKSVDEVEAYLGLPILGRAPEFGPAPKA